MSAWETVATIFGMGLITIVTRAFFMIPEREVPLPAWVKQGLRYAPLAALVAVTAPELFMNQGHLIHTWRDARLPAEAASSAYFFWRHDILGTIVSGTAVMLVFHLGFGW